MNRDLSKLRFPLFETTEQEKKLLRQAELYLIEHNEGHVSLCNVLSKLPKRHPKQIQSCLQWGRVASGLREKICGSLGGDAFLEGALRHSNGLFDNYLFCKSPRLLRRYWITLLLNYNPKDKQHD